MQNPQLQKLISNLHSAQEEKNKKNQIQALIKLAEYHYNDDNYSKAKISLNQIIKLNSKTPNVNYYLSLIELQEENYEKAIFYIDKELIINPNNVLAKDLKDKLKVNSNIPLVTLFLVLINFIVFIFTYPKISLLYSIKYGISEFSIAKGITSLFFHINAFHFTTNIIILIMFGLILEKNIGSIKFLMIYLISGFIGNMSQFLLIQDGIVLGASAALFGILGAIMMREPLFEVRLFGVIKVPLILVLGAFFLLSALINLYIKIDFTSGDIAHFIGLMIGIIIMGFIYSETISIFYNWLFISFGFWLVQYAVQNLIQKTYFITTIPFGDVIIILIGIMLVFYSYIHLKLSLSFKVD